MTMHIALGDGEMTRRELTETLSDLWQADEKAGNTFWFLIQGKSDPTDTDKSLVTWLAKNSIYFEVITDDKDAMSDIYSEAQEVHVAKQLSRKVLSLLESKPEKDETAELLALFFSDDSTADEDRWLNQVCQDVFDAGFPVRALNDGLLEVDLSAPETTETEEVPDNVRAMPVKGGASKRAASRPDTKVSEEDETPATSAPATYTRSQLEDMDLDGLKAVAASLNITLPPRTRMGTYVDAILGVDDTPVAEVTAVADPSLNGDIDMDALADAIVDRVMERLAAAFSS